MTTQAGVWIDHRQAIVVLITEVGQQITKIDSGIAKPVRSKPGNKNAPTDFVADDRLERKVDSQLKSFYDDVFAGLQGTESLLILGPGEAKVEFIKHKKLHGVTVELETADKMTDRQLVAKVREYFGHAPARNFDAPRRSAQAL